MGYSKLWKSMRFNEMCVLGGGYFFGKWVRCCAQVVFIRNMLSESFRLLLRKIWERCVYKRPHGVVTPADIQF